MSCCDTTRQPPAKVLRAELVCRLQSCIVSTYGQVSLFSSVVSVEKNLHFLSTGDQVKLSGSITEELINVLYIFWMHIDCLAVDKRAGSQLRGSGAAGGKIALKMLLLFHLLLVLLHWKNTLLVIMDDFQILVILE